MISKVADRLQKIQDNNPRFVNLLAYLVEPMADADYSTLDFVEPDDVSERKKKSKKTRANTPVSKLDPQQIQTMCRQRFGLMSMNDLLDIIDRIKRAEQGKKNLPNS